MKKIVPLLSFAVLLLSSVDAWAQQPSPQPKKKLEFAHAISPLESPMSIRNLRREIARLKTELKKKQLSA